MNLKFSNYPGHQYLIVERSNYNSYGVNIDIERDAEFFSFNATVSLKKVHNSEESTRLIIFKIIINIMGPL